MRPNISYRQSGYVLFTLIALTFALGGLYSNFVIQRAWTASRFLAYGLGPLVVWGGVMARVRYAVRKNPLIARFSQSARQGGQSCSVFWMKRFGYSLPLRGSGGCCAHCKLGVTWPQTSRCLSLFRSAHVLLSLDFQ